MYRIQSNNTKHLVGLCKQCGWRYLPMIYDLDIPEIYQHLKSKKVNGIREDKSQMLQVGGLFDLLKEKKIKRSNKNVFQN